MSNSQAFEIYVASLSDYNNGISHGYWISFCTCDDVDEVKESIAEMLAASPTSKQTGQMAEEWAILDYDIPGKLKIMKHENIDDLWQIYENMSELEDEEIEPFFIFLTYRGGARPMSSDIDDFRDVYRGQYDSETDFAEELADDLGYLDQMPENLRCYFDYEKFSSDLFITNYWMEDGYVFSTY